MTCKFAPSSVALATGILGLLFHLTSCTPAPDTAPWTKGAPVFGDIPITMTVYDHPDNGDFDAVVQLMDTIDREMSMWDRPFETDIMRLSKAAGTSAVTVSPDTLVVVKTALGYAQTMDGALDVAIGPLVKLWGVATSHPKVPLQSEVEALLPLTKMSDIEVSGSSIFLKKKGMVVDLGGIAKGYAADRACALLKSRGIRSAVIDIGGNIYALGGKPDGQGGVKNWRIGVQDPERDRGEAIGVLEGQDLSLATSGIYERRFTENGKSYHHILDPKTGWPADNELASVSIVGKPSIACDGYGKVLVLGLKKAWETVQKVPGIQAIFITKDHKVYVTPALAKDFTLTSPNYTLADRP